jgi:hypothetical protein
VHEGKCHGLAVGGDCADLVGAPRALATDHVTVLGYASGEIDAGLRFGCWLALRGMI